MINGTPINTARTRGAKEMDSGPDNKIGKIFSIEIGIRLTSLNKVNSSQPRKKVPANKVNISPINKNMNPKIIEKTLATTFKT